MIFVLQFQSARSLLIAFLPYKMSRSLMHICISDSQSALSLFYTCVSDGQNFFGNRPHVSRIHFLLLIFNELQYSGDRDISISSYELLLVFFLPLYLTFLSSFAPN